MTRRLTLLVGAGLLVGACAGSGTGVPSPDGTPPVPATASVTPASPVAATSSPPAAPTPEADLPTRIAAILGPDWNGAALVAHDGETLFAEGLGMADEAAGRANTPETRFRIGSITKQLTGMAILVLEARGLVDRGDPVCNYVDDCPTAWSAVTIEHLLAHTSGIASFTDQPDFDMTSPSTPAETVADVADIPLAWEPGAFFGYNNTGYVLLGMVIERASGVPYEQFLREAVFDPLGMADTGYEDGDTPGLATGYTSGFSPAAPIDMSIPYAAGGLYSTVLDLARWAATIETDTLVPADAAARFTTPLVDTTDRIGFGYGYGVHVGAEDGHRIVAHDGGIDGFYTYLARYPDDDLTIVLLANREQAPDHQVNARAIARAVLGEP
ncbi:MAG TPA: serine hydrolase domain-containing protein [Candidatus Limnocylindrales bacterium]|nr:serine hydrolase domain-containing protein [Candidatus Limnocylindrales bacterium]